LPCLFCRLRDSDGSLKGAFPGTKGERYAE
jgi:hypothetical protein